MIINFVVMGQPQGKARPRFANGRVYTPKATKDYEEKVKKAYLTAANGYGGYGFGDKPVILKITAFLKKAKSNKRICATTKPDLDNIVKAVLDGLNGVAFFDDKQVIGINAIKLYCCSSEAVPYLEVSITDGTGTGI